MLIKQVHKKNLEFVTDIGFKYETYLCNGFHDLM